MNKQQLAEKIWALITQTRYKLDSTDYKDCVLGFIFYKFLSEKEEKYLKEIGYEKTDVRGELNEETVVATLQSELGYYIVWDNLFSTWTEKSDLCIKKIQDALVKFEHTIAITHRELYSGIFSALQFVLNKMDKSVNSQMDAVIDIIQAVDEIPMKEQDFDVLGLVYEFLLQKFDMTSGKNSGEYFSPHEVSALIAKIIVNHLDDRKEINIYDPTGGSGLLLVNVGRAVAHCTENTNHIHYFAKDISTNCYNMIRMNLIMHGINANMITTSIGDTLANDWPVRDSDDGRNEPVLMDAVASNPPYSLQHDRDALVGDPRFAQYGYAPRTKADFAFLLHGLYHLKSDGIMTIVLPHGVLFREGEEGVIRRNLINANHIDAIIGLPEKIFVNTNISTVIIILKKQRSKTDIQMIDASRFFIKDGKRNKMRSSDIKRITDAIAERKDIDRFSKVISFEEIQKNKCNLSLQRYIGTTEPKEEYDFLALMSGGIPGKELDCLNAYWETMPGLKELLFEPREDDDAYWKLKTSEIGDTIRGSSVVQLLRCQYEERLELLRYFIKKDLLGKLGDLNTEQDEEYFFKNVFDQIKGMPLVDKYEVYQVVSDSWKVLSEDMEIIQIEGTQVIRQVAPVMVTKIRAGKKNEIQDGWEGRIIPFSHVQETLLAEELSEIQKIKDEIMEINSRLRELLEETVDEMPTDLIKEDGSSFISAAISKETKRIRLDIKSGAIIEKESFKSIVLEVDELNSRTKDLNRLLKERNEYIQEKTKRIFEDMDEITGLEMLCRKWSRLLSAKLLEMVQNSINHLIEKVRGISEKYSLNLSDVETDIDEAEKTLFSMIGSLNGDKSDMKGLDALQKFLGGA